MFLDRFQLLPNVFDGITGDPEVVRIGLHAGIQDEHQHTPFGCRFMNDRIPNHIPSLKSA